MGQETEFFTSIEQLIVEFSEKTLFLTSLATLPN